jgi:hypothetical protein
MIAAADPVVNSKYLDFFSSNSHYFLFRILFLAAEV